MIKDGIVRKKKLKKKETVTRIISLIYVNIWEGTVGPVTMNN